MKMIRPTTDDVRAKFATVRRELSAALIERDEEVDLVLTALVASEHVLLVGPPGCGKSLLLDSVLVWTGGLERFWNESFDRLDAYVLDLVQARLEV